MLSRRAEGTDATDDAAAAAAAKRRRTELGAVPSLQMEPSKVRVQNSILAALQELESFSDADSDSTTESEDRAGMLKFMTAVPTGAADSESDSSSSSSSSSSSESSESADEPAEHHLTEVESDDEIPETAEDREVQDLHAMKRMHLRRSAIIDMLLQLPRDVAEKAILHSFVQIRSGSAMLLAEVQSLGKTQESYLVKHPRGDLVSVDLTLRCKRGATCKDFKVCVISNQDLSEAALAQWKRVTGRIGIDASNFLDARSWAKAQQIHEVLRFSWDEATVSRLLNQKGLGSKTKAQLKKMGATYGTAEFEKRAQDEKKRLHYSLRDVNKKNQERQVARDKFALNYTYRHEASGFADLNPFERRACRPITAWDTNLTSVSDQPVNQERARGNAPESREQVASALTSDLPKASGQKEVKHADPVAVVVRAHKTLNQIFLAQFGHFGIL